MKKIISFFKNWSWTNSAILMLLIGFIIITSVPIFFNQYLNWSLKFDSKVASEIGGYVSGFVGVFWSGAGVILIYATFQEQKKLIVKQQFEASFFKLLDTYNNLLNSIQEKQENSELKVGKAYISQVWQKIKDGQENVDLWVELSNTQNSSISEIKSLQKDFEEFNKGGTIPCDMKDYLINQEPNKFLYLKTTNKSDEFHFAQFNYFLNKYKSKLDPYCRFIFNIFKYVDEEDKKSAKRYLKILWAQMSEEELIVLFYYAKNKELLGYTKFLSWLKKYDFLDDLSNGVFLKNDHKERFC